MDKMVMLYIASATANTSDDKTTLYIAGATATIIVGILAAIINVVLNVKNNRVLKEERFIDAISAERVKWINTLRDKFSEYNKLVHIQMNGIDSIVNLNGRSIEELKIEELRKRAYEITFLHNHIELFLNPTEPVTEKLLQTQDKVTRYLTATDYNMFNYEEVKQWALNLHYLQQVILKSEWKRVKEENEKGKEINDQRMNEIFINTAKKIDSDKYESLELSQVEQLNNFKNENGKELPFRKRFLYKYLHWIIRFLIVCIGLGVINIILTYFGINIKVIEFFGSAEFNVLIASAGVLLTIESLLPIIEERYNYKR
ncbi:MULTISPECIES: hypothetical protein [Bacillus cereus group]|uniref:hypothetical protein n=1 Tax=Bacillus cereus group TaxID=86661 RepID=UPI000BF882D4|nr:MULTISPECIES: hypothetical protein [Bacillus cereus group]PGA23613.1 hypothetical protein COL80_23090 [Bacillus thuringiensis]PGU85358.1 hypothetical protein COD76_06615 [Bacillus cereus]